MDVIEFITSPNNPDGEMKKSVLGGKAIYDHAYFWPQYTPILAPSDHDLLIFTLYKLTGLFLSLRVMLARVLGKYVFYVIWVYIHYTNTIVTIYLYVF